MSCSLGAHQSIFAIQLSPNLSIRKTVLREGGRQNLPGVARVVRYQITPVSNRDRIDEMFMQMIHVLDDPVLHRARNAEIIEDRKMLHVFAQSHPSSVRADRYLELRSHQ